MNWQAILDSIVKWGMTAGLRLLVALILLLITFKIINAVARGLGKKAEKRGLDKTITRTIIYISKLAAKVAVAICLVGYVGIDTSGLAALITSFGVCIGLAVNGAVSNLAGGIVLILTRPFKLDDFIEACGYSGTVEEIRVTQTKLRTGDNKVVYLGTQNDILGNSLLWGLAGGDVASLIEAGMPAWQAACDTFNNK